MSITEIRDQSGVERKLGYLPPTTDHSKMRAMKMNVGDLRAQLVPNEPPVFSLAQLKDIVQKRGGINFAKGAPKSLILNQGQYGSCVGFSCAGASARQRWIRGQDAMRLSGSFCYDQINGGQDNGAVIMDALGVMEGTGIPLESAYSSHPIFRTGQIPSGAIMFKEDVSITWGSALELATIIVMNILGQGPASAGERGFSQFSGDGLIYNGGHGSGNPDHSVYYAGLEWVANQLVFPLVNSWDVTYGPFGEGWAYMTFGGVDACAQANDGWGHASTPGDQNPAPTPAE